MSTNRPRILVTCSSGTNGLAAVKSLAKTNLFNIRAAVRTAKRIPAEKRFDCIEYIVLNNNDPESITAAFKSVDYIYLITPLLDKAFPLVKCYIDAAKAAGVKYIIRLSAIVSSATSPLQCGRDHYQSDQYLINSSINYTILQPNLFADNYYRFDLKSIKARSVFYGSAGDGKCSYIDCRDIASIVTVLFQTPAEYIGSSMILTGPKAYSDSSAALFISNTIGKTVQYISWPSDIHLTNLLSFGLSEWQSNDLVAIDKMKLQGLLSAVTETVQTILQRPPITLEQHIADYSVYFK